MVDSEWGVSTSAACCLRIMATLLWDEIVDPVINYAGSKISEDNNPKDIYVGLLSLGTIVVGPSTDFISQKYSLAIDVLLKLLQNRSKKIWETTAWLLNLLANYCPSIFEKEDVIWETVSIIHGLLKTDETAGGLCCQFIGKFSEQI